MIANKDDDADDNTVQSSLNYYYRITKTILVKMLMQTKIHPDLILHYIAAETKFVLLLLTHFLYLRRTVVDIEDYLPYQRHDQQCGPPSWMTSEPECLNDECPER